jgi:DHA1 family bicyclomycin/chloramphenicol resistance-like MFS transporter
MAKAAKPHTRSIGFTLQLGALVTLASFATDMGLPVLDATANSLGVTAARAALTLSIFMAGFALGPLLFGPISDRVGRRPVLLSGVAVFAVCGALAAFSRSIEALLFWRLLMGIGAGSAQVLVLAVVRDLFTGAEARARQSYVNLAAGVAPIIAPTVGVAVAAAFGGWRSIYALLAIGGAVLLASAAVVLEETAPPSGHALTIRGTLANYARVATHPVSAGYAAVMALGFGGLFAYVSGSSLVLMGVMGASRRAYGILFACASFGLVSGAFVNARLARRGVSHTRVITIGLAMMVLTTATLFALSATGVLSVVSFVALLVANNIALGAVRPNAAQGMLEPMPEIVGVASAFLGGVQTLTGAASSAIAASLFDGRTANAMTGTMVICALAAFVVYRLVVYPAEKRMHAEKAGATGERPIEDVGATVAA